MTSSVYCVSSDQLDKKILLYFLNLNIYFSNYNTMSIFCIVSFINLKQITDKVIRIL